MPDLHERGATRFSQRGVPEDAARVKQV